MKQTSARFLIIAAFVVAVGGCSQPKKADPEASGSLGPGVTHVLERPTRIAGWNFQRADMSIASDPPIQELDVPLAKDLSGVLLSGSTYATPARGGAFERAVGFRVWRGDQAVDVLLSFNNDQAVIKSAGYSGQMGTSVVGVGAARDKLLALAKRAFPEYRPQGK